MKAKSRSILILAIVFGYIILQFIAWEIMFVKKTGEIIELKQKLTELSTTDTNLITQEVNQLHEKKRKQVIMIVGEGTVFLLLLLFGVYKIKQAQDKENKLNAQQKNFFLSITHELKTPISATKLQLQTMQKHKLDEEQREQLIKSALFETERLNSLIDNLLLASRFESGEFLFKKSKENVSTLTEEIIKRYYKNEIAANQLNSKIDDDIFMEIDKNAFPSILTNLIDNAFKYSQEKKNILVELNKVPGKIILRVSDMGNGITDEDKQKIFDKFYRAGNEETRTAKGTGLGLFIVKYLVSHHSGKISVKNNIPQGSIFEIEFNGV